MEDVGTDFRNIEHISPFYALVFKMKPLNKTTFVVEALSHRKQRGEDLGTCEYENTDDNPANVIGARFVPCNRLTCIVRLE